MRAYGATVLRSLLIRVAAFILLPALGASKERDMMRRTLCLVVLALSLSLAACAGSTAPPPQGTHPSWLAGTWQGTAWQVAAGKDQGEANVTVTFAGDGTWKASTGAAGTSWLVGDRVVLEGVAPDGAKIRYTLKERERADGREVWGIVEANFGAAAVSLKRIR